ncbi:hypothetical protein GmHk_01G001886 [Glycine max]|nr:hypothetical protein GmHk_01G001886 [Glycine max]
MRGAHSLLCHFGGDVLFMVVHRQVMVVLVIDLAINDGDWTRSVAYEIGFMAVIMRSNTNIGIRGRTSFVLIDCERSGQYRTKKKDLDEKIIVSDMTKSMVTRNILLTLKEHNANSYTTIKQIYNARNVYHSSIRVGKKNAWDYVMEAWGSLVDCPSEQEFDNFLMKFEIVCSPWPMFVDYVKQTWLIPHKERFVKAWTNKVMHLGNTTTNRLRFSDQRLSKLEVSITKEMETITKRFKELDVYGKVTLKIKLREISYPDLNSLCAPPKKVKTKGAQKQPMTKHQRSTKCDPSYWEYVDALHSVQNSNSSVKRSASSSDQAKPRRIMPMLDQFHPRIHDSIENIVDVKADGNCGYRAIVSLLGMGEDSWFWFATIYLKNLQNGLMSISTCLVALTDLRN